MDLPYADLSEDVQKAMSSISQEEYIRILLQFLNDRGLTRSAETLEQESRVEYEDESIQRIRVAVKQQNWFGSDDSLFSLLLQQNFQSPEARTRALTTACLRHYGHLILTDDRVSALDFLKARVLPLAKPPPAVASALASLVLVADEERLGRMSRSLAVIGGETEILATLSGCLTPGMLIGPARLERMAGQALQHQVSSDHVHFGPIINHSILSDFCSTKKALISPQTTVFHAQGECYCACTNIEHTLLVVGDSSGTLTVLSPAADDPGLRAVKLSHAAVQAVCLSHDQEQVLAGMHDGTVYDISLVDLSFRVVTSFASDAAVVGIQRYDKGFLLATVGGLYYIGSTGGYEPIPVTPNHNDSFEFGALATCDTAVHALVSGHVMQIDVRLGQPMEVIKAAETAGTTMALSSGGQRIAIAGPHCPLVVYDKSYGVVRSFTGHLHERYVIHPSFIEVNDLPIYCAIGGEDGVINIFSMTVGESIQRIPCHAGSCNGVLSLERVGMVASYGDDKKIILHGINR
ncbi:LIS1 (LisH) motif [Carpediemonas membranifera]|uniref:LIS1 (LisH) motif n=1 Tax=Carpediemonas membranifera TaxID=201153 RepID=A0A8J6B524_9EUKA|nr:LIS1 (LisH) motif [Carpediemonas membranifera]|eukprot:KAG9395823.1 LIS1 (LisH) motif [Carpediemonas membranifera]